MTTMTRNIHGRTHGAGMPTSIPNAHGMMAYGPVYNATSFGQGMFLPPENVAYDPSNPVSDPYEQHYQTTLWQFAPVATRSPYFIPQFNPATGDQITGAAGTRPVR